MAFNVYSVVAVEEFVILLQIVNDLILTVDGEINSARAAHAEWITLLRNAVIVLFVLIKQVFLAHFTCRWYTDDEVSARSKFALNVDSAAKRQHEVFTDA